jgi:uncharacterized protein involved in high-affinity Fe2+ transport
VGAKCKKTGTLLAMTAKDGPHYANNIALMGDGDYGLTYHFKPPSKAGFIRHVDKNAECQIGGTRSPRAALFITRAKKPD